MSQKHHDEQRLFEHCKQFRIEPHTRVRLKDFDPRFCGKYETKKQALQKIESLRKQMDDLQYKLYAEKKRSVLICLQGLDAAGKDGVVRHVLFSMNPEGCRAVSFKEPSKEELAHDFLWRIENRAPKRGEVVIFNRSHYEDVLIVRVHHLVPKEVWSKRYEQINEFEQRLFDNGTHILKFFLHISKKEQLARFKQRLDDPARQWKISEADYSERDYWSDYEKAYEDVLEKCSTRHAPWYVIPSDRKWFRDLTVSAIIVDAMQKLDIRLPAPTVNIAAMRKKYHQQLRGK